jgi:hypothetical protein
LNDNSFQSEISESISQKMSHNAPFQLSKPTVVNEQD